MNNHNESTASTSWHFDGHLKARADREKPHQLIPALPGSNDIAKVVNSYQISPVSGYYIAKVEVIYNPNLNRSFALQTDILERRHDNPAFTSKWFQEPNHEWRRTVVQRFKDWAKDHKDPITPHVDILPLWHGTSTAALESLCHSGYASLATTDAGFFGKGIYSAVEASYAYRAYSKGALIVNWVAMGSAYPVIDGDMEKLMGKANYQNYDAHIIPVKPRDPNNPNELNYYPCQPNEKATYHEVVVFNYQQCLPRYLVTLQPALPKKLVPQWIETPYFFASILSLFAAIQRHDVLWVLSCIKSGIDLNVTHNKYHALAAALRCPTPEIFSYLCQALNPSIPQTVQFNGNGHHLLNLLWTHSPWTVEEKRQQLRQLMGYGLNCLHPIWRAVCFDDKPAIENHLHSPDADTNLRDVLGCTPFFSLVMGGHLEMIQYWLFKKPDALNEKTEQGATALLCAAVGGHLPVIQWLLKEGKASLNEQDHFENTALLCAALNGHLTVVQWLLTEGGDNGAKRNTWGANALLCAAENGQLPVVQWLIEEGKAHGNQRNAYGMTALLCAAEKGHLPVIQWLLEKGHAQWDQKNHNNNTALLKAACNGHLPVVQWLLTKKGVAMVQERNNNGNTALLLAAEKGHLPVVQYLLRNSESKVDEHNRRGNTALLKAARNGRLLVVQWLLIEGGAALNEHNHIGQTATDLASINHHQNVLDFLKSYDPKNTALSKNLHGLLANGGQHTEEEQPEETSEQSSKCCLS